MISQPIFKQFNLPVARSKDSVPLFLDFSILPPNGNSNNAIDINETLIQEGDQIDGIILSATTIPHYMRLNRKDLWIRVDTDAWFLPADYLSGEIQHPTPNIDKLATTGLSGILGTLIMGNTATNEGDNIQFLSSLRSKSIDMGVPLIIDLHVINNNSQNQMREIVELGLNLAIELGCDLAIIPCGEYITSSEAISKIKKVPLLVRNFIQPPRFGAKRIDWNEYGENVDGIVYSGI